MSFYTDDEVARIREIWGDRRARIETHLTDIEQYSVNDFERPLGPCPGVR